MYSVLFLLTSSPQSIPPPLQALIYLLQYSQSHWGIYKLKNVIIIDLNFECFCTKCFNYTSKMNLFVNLDYIFFQTEA